MYVVIGNNTQQQIQVPCGQRAIESDWYTVLSLPTCGALYSNIPIKFPIKDDCVEIVPTAAAY